MDINTCKKDSFSVIGKEGSPKDGGGFIQALWTDANMHFSEVAGLARKDEKGNILGIWGLMSDFSRSFMPWDNFSEGLYLAGVEAADDSEPPPGWVKWTAPAYEYLYLKADGKYGEMFSSALSYMADNGLKLAGAAFDCICTREDGQLYLYFPIRRL